MSDEKRFGQLLAEYKGKGLSDEDAMLAAADDLMLEHFKWQQAKDADFEIIQPKQISGGQKTVEEISNEPYNYCMEILTEDIPHEVIEPKQLSGTTPLSDVNSVSNTEK